MHHQLLSPLGKKKDRPPRKLGMGVTAGRQHELSRIATILIFPVALLAVHTHASSLGDIGIHGCSPAAPAPPNATRIPMQECSRKCMSENCLVPPLMRYGKYCGVFYSGCAGEEPCDALDACCLRHDNCIGLHGNEYLNHECNANFLQCVEEFLVSGSPSFKGSKCAVHDVVEVMSLVIEGALLIGKLH